MESLGFSLYSIMSSANNDSLTSSFPFWMLFFSYLCLIAVAKISTTMLNKSGEYNAGSGFFLYGFDYVERCSIYSHFAVTFFVLIIKTLDFEGR